MPQHAVEKFGFGNLVRIEDRDELPGGAKQRVVDVAGLGEPWLALPVGAAGDVADADPTCRGRELRPVTVVEYPCLVWIMHIARRNRGFHDDIERFIIGSNENIDGSVYRSRGGGVRREIPRRYRIQNGFGGYMFPRVSAELRSTMPPTRLYWSIAMRGMTPQCNDSNTSIRTIASLRLVTNTSPRRKTV
jgi:hypothetical protein